MSSVVKSAERAMAVLLLLSRAGTALSTLQIAQRCGIPKSSAHHLLNVLQRMGFLNYDESGRLWRLGPASWEVGSAYLRGDPLQNMARGVMRDLSETVGVTSHLAVLDGTDVLYIKKSEPSINAVRLVTEEGTRLPAHLTSVGLAILSRLPDREIGDRFASTGLLIRTGRGPSTIGELMQVVGRVRQRGYAQDDGMVTPGVSCIAAAVTDHADAPVASIGVTYVSAQFEPQRLDFVVGAVRSAADRLSSSIGGSGRSDRERIPRERGGLRSGS